MREIVKTVSVHVDGKPVDFRLTKLDAFSGGDFAADAVRDAEGIRGIIKPGTVRFLVL